MAETSLTHPYDIANELDLEADSLKTGLELMYDVLGFVPDDAGSVSEAQGRLYFLANAIGDIQKRLESLARKSHRLYKAAKAAA